MPRDSLKKIAFKQRYAAIVWDTPGNPEHREIWTRAREYAAQLYRECREAMGIE